MEALRSDSAFYVSRDEAGALIGFSRGCVDDMLRARAKQLREISQRTAKRFSMGEDVVLPCDFSGFRLDFDENGDVTQTQRGYLKQLEPLPLDATYVQFRSMHMKLTWLANTRPDLMFEISQLAQVTEEVFNNYQESTIRRLNKTTKFAMDNPIRLKFSKLNLDSMRVVCFSNSSFVNNHDLSTQLGHVSIFSEDAGNAIDTPCKSYKSKRVVRLALAG